MPASFVHRGIQADGPRTTVKAARVILIKPGPPEAAKSGRFKRVGCRLPQNTRQTAAVFDPPRPREPPRPTALAALWRRPCLVASPTACGRSGLCLRSSGLPALATEVSRAIHARRLERGPCPAEVSRSLRDFISIPPAPRGHTGYRRSGCCAVWLRGVGPAARAAKSAALAWSLLPRSPARPIRCRVSIP